MQPLTSKHRRLRGLPKRWLHRPSFGIISLAAAFVGHGAQAAPLDPGGLWLTDGGGSIIKIAACKSAYCGTLVWLREPTDADGTPKRDAHNTDAAQRARPMLGIELVIDLMPEDNHWRGKAYNPQDGKFYDVTFKLANDQPAAKTAEIRGCVLRILCQTQVLTRANAIPAASP